MQGQIYTNNICLLQNDKIYFVKMWKWKIVLPLYGKVKSCPLSLRTGSVIADGNLLLYN